jgi:hypothetical protein
MLDGLMTNEMSKTLSPASVSPRRGGARRSAMEEDIFAAFEPAELDEYRALMLKLLASLRGISTEVDGCILSAPGAR